ncbi:bifunctional pyr operon transcriptional regulator/uracil phosphoribosyltransferase PyrR [Traorella massiliensis]|uniref:bifunctional pyr operon transcriptional regulator/uracil phosphoribosyltransferase PyrR n=1 Tax=Traorella massiliensis TaxID=1903263 RepID=UPI00235372A2|nr:bifunctional pyr operon transcriptional regulator/uracil phosphoribosyltransferase PyrR [Traorella massiliensis]
MEEKMILDEDGMRRSLTRMSHEIIERNKGVDNLVLVGIKTRGEYLANRIASFIEKVEGTKIEVYPLDIKAWRDDLDIKHPLPEITFSVSDKKVVLVDDVLFKGRTVRAALEGVLHFGRAKEVQLAVLVDRGHRELPIRADYVGKNIPSSLNENIKVQIKEIDGQDQVVIERK